MGAKRPLSLSCYKEVIGKILLDFCVKACTSWFAVTEAFKNYKSLKTFTKLKAEPFLQISNKSLNRFILLLKKNFKTGPTLKCSN